MNSASYSLRQIVDLTGLSEFTLRGWENRYAAFSPQRTNTGRREYNDQDLKKAILLRELVKRNHRISKIAALKVSELEALMIDRRSASAESTTSAPPRREVVRLMKALALQEFEKLDALVERAVGPMAPLVAIREFIIPVLIELGREVALNRMTIAQEHILSATLKRQLHILAEPKSRAGRFRFVMFAPEGDYHELGLLSSHAMACQMGLKSLYLGANTPKQDVCETALRFGATHLLLSANLTKTEGAREDFFSLINFLDQNLPDNVELWSGGRATAGCNLKRRSKHIATIQQMENELESLSKGR